MQTADLLTLCTRVFTAICLLVFSTAYAVRGEWAATTVFCLLSTLMWTLAARLYQRVRAERAHGMRTERTHGMRTERTHGMHTEKKP